MKKGLCICMVILCITGCSGQRKNEWEQEMQKHANVYYEKYMKNVNGQTKNEISIQALKDVNAKLGKTFDLQKLKSCKDSSYVTLTVDEKSRTIKNYTYHLDCK